jgi:preprotein translocase subunit SecA
MAGRGTDIQLGGNLDMRILDEAMPIADEAAREKKIAQIRAEVAAEREEVLQAGGLYVIGTERHESRRIDNQLRGRSGRQGDPGASKFFLSLEDDLMRIFGSERMDGMLKRLGLKEDEAIIHPWINKALEKAQQKVEARNFDIRKNLLRFDDVMNDQRKVVYEQRLEIMEAKEVGETVADMRRETIDRLVRAHIPENSYADKWETEKLQAEMLRIFNLELPVVEWGKEEGIAEQEIAERLHQAANEKMAAKEKQYGADVMRMVEKSLLLQLLDQNWKEHLHHLDQLRHGIGLRAYAQRDPLNEYKREAFDLFDTMLEQLRESITSVLAQIELRVGAPDAVPPPPPLPSMQELHGDEPIEQGGVAVREAPRRVAANGRTQSDPRDPLSWGKVQRNAACPCGSGKKYKHCHGATR